MFAFSYCPSSWSVDSPQIKQRQFTDYSKHSQAQTEICGTQLLIGYSSDIENKK